MRRAGRFWELILIEGLTFSTMKPLEVSAPQPLEQGEVFARVPGLKSTEIHVFPASGAAVNDSTERVCPVRL